MYNVCPKIARCCLAIILFIVLSPYANATHIVGMDFYYRWVSGSTYKITLVVYGDCGNTSGSFAALPGSTPQVCIYDSTNFNGSINLSVEPPSSGVEITPVCPADLGNTQCTDVTNTIPGIKKFIYSGNYTLPHTSRLWRFVFSGALGSSFIAGRAGSITNLTAATVTQLVDTLNNTVYNNSSPALTVIPTPFFCLSNSNNYNPGAVDADGDSLRFYLVPGKGLTAASCSSAPDVSYVFPYTASAPLAASSFSFDPTNGQLSFIPSALQRSLVVYNIREFRAGQMVGTCQREMTFIVLTCTNNPPRASFNSATNGTIDDSIHFHICENAGPYSIRLNPTSDNPDNNIWVTATGLPAGCTLATTGNGTRTPVTTINWTSTGVAPGSYNIYITYTDDNCPLVGTRTLAYTITVLPSPTVSYSVVTPATCTQKAYLSITPSGLGPFRVAISRGAGDTIRRFTGVTGISYDSLSSGTYTITVFSGPPDRCPGSIAAVIPNPPPFTYYISYTSPTYCGRNDGTITISDLVPGSVDTIRYSYNGVPQTPVIATANASGAIVLTGLYAGNYTTITVSYGNCISAPMSLIVLNDPPVPDPWLTFTNPTYCGHNDGTITLHGLLPGMTDTVRFYYNSVLQPYVVRTVGADSTITLTGLYAGVYAGITIRYRNCISSPVGPVTLVNPSIPVPTGTFTHPTYCGHNDGTITISNLYPGDRDTIRYYYNSVLQPPRVLTVSSAGTVILTGLLAGVYSNITASYGPCVTEAIGPFTLINPPVPLATGTYTNPSYCGHNDGTITIGNLYPGDLDTIKFYFNGVLQPPRVMLVSSAGTVTLTGLIAGLYSGITATYGSCVTEPVGPFTLTDPPLLIPSATYSSPTYCGSTDGYITISNLHPGDADTIWYFKNGVLQAPRYLTVSAGGIVTITGLGAGVYSNIYAQYRYCITDTMGPITLTEPAFTMTGVTFTHPTKCGFCDGTMRFYGLHPGQTDSVHFIQDGTPGFRVATVLPDSTILLTGLCEGTYSNVYVNFNANCVSDTFGPFVLDAPPIIPGFTYTLTKNCAGDTLYCTNTSWPATDLTYVWDFGDSTTSTDVSPTHVYTVPGVYTVTLYITNTRCTDSTSVTLTLDNLVIAGLIAEPDSFVCTGTPIAFTNTSRGYNLTYYWDFGDGTTLTTANAAHVYTAVGTYQILMAVANSAPCRDTERITMQVDPVSDISMSVTDTTLCAGQYITLTSVYDAGGNTGVVWYFGDGDSILNVNPVVHTYTTSGLLTVTAKALYRACPDTSVSRNIWVTAIPTVNLGPDTSICPGSAGLVLGDAGNASNAAARWRWNTGQTTSSIGIAEVGTYSVTVNINGCEASDAVDITANCFINIPNAFSPNGDGVNDYFVPRDYLRNGLTSFRMEIFNRWGNSIFLTTNTEGRGWDGKFNDVLQPEGVYIYVIDATFKDGQQDHKKGNLTLLR